MVNTANPRISAQPSIPTIIMNMPHSSTRTKIFSFLCPTVRVDLAETIFISVFKTPMVPGRSLTIWEIRSIQAPGIRHLMSLQTGNTFSSLPAERMIRVTIPTGSMLKSSKI